MAGWDVLEPITLESGFDLLTQKGRAEAMAYLEKERPDVVVFAWPCTPWTRMRECFGTTPAQQARYEKEKGAASKDDA